MSDMPLYTRICLSILPVVFLSECAFAQCPHTSQDIALSTAPTTLTIPKEQEQASDRTVFLELTLNKKGAVRDATLRQGPTALREAAVKAVKKHNYKREMNDWPFSRHIVVEVKFGQDNDSLPEIRSVMWGGVPACVYPTAIRVAPEVMQSHLLRRVEPVFPIKEPPAGESTIVLRVRIDKDGNVLKAEKISGPDTLAAPAIQAVKAWKYETYTLNGYPFEVETTVELKFSE